MRGHAITEAEHARQQARMAILDELRSASVQFPGAATMAEACQRAGIDVDDIDRRLKAIPAPDSAGLLWLCSEYERAEADGTFFHVQLPE